MARAAATRCLGVRAAMRARRAAAARRITAAAATRGAQRRDRRLSGHSSDSGIEREAARSTERSDLAVPGGRRSAIAGLQHNPTAGSWRHLTAGLSARSRGSKRRCFCSEAGIHLLEHVRDRCGGRVTSLRAHVQHGRQRAQSGPAGGARSGRARGGRSNLRRGGRTDALVVDEQGERGLVMLLGGGSIAARRSQRDGSGGGSGCMRFLGLLYCRSSMREHLQLALPHLLLQFGALRNL